MTIKVETDRQLMGPTGRTRSPFLNYCNKEFAKMKAGDSFDVMKQAELVELAHATARNILTPRIIGQRVQWAFTTWSKLNGNRLAARVRRDGKDYIIFIVPKPRKQGEFDV